MGGCIKGGGGRGVAGDVFIIHVGHRFPRISPGNRDFARLLGRPGVNSASLKVIYL